MHEHTFPDKRKRQSEIWMGHISLNNPFFSTIAISLSDISLLHGWRGVSCSAVPLYFFSPQISDSLKLRTTTTHLSHTHLTCTVLLLLLLPLLRVCLFQTFSPLLVVSLRWFWNISSWRRRDNFKIKIRNVYFAGNQCSHTHITVLHHFHRVHHRSINPQNKLLCFISVFLWWRSKQASYVYICGLWCWAF